MKTFVTLAVGAGLAVLPCAVMAETHVYARSGPWEAFDGTDDAGDAVCGISTHWDDGQYFGLKRFGGDDHLTVQASRPAWRFGGGNVAVVFRMDDNPFWTATGTTGAGKNAVWFNIPLTLLGSFSRQLQQSSEFILSMGDNHIRWTIDLSGTSTMMKDLAQCVAVMPQ